MTKEKEFNFARVSLILGIVAIITGLLMINIGGVSVAVPIGIFGIAFACISKKPEGFSRQGKLGLIFSITGLVTGFIAFAMLYSTLKLMNDPEMSKELLNYIKQILPNLPEGVGELVNGYF